MNLDQFFFNETQEFIGNEGWLDENHFFLSFLQSAIDTFVY